MTADGSTRGRSTFVALSGGGSRRMGRDKALLEVDGRAMLERLLEEGRSACSRCVLVAGDAGPYADALRRWGWRAAGTTANETSEAAGRFRRGGTELRLVTDRHPGRGPVAGLEAGLGAAPGPLCFVSACDLPFLTARVVTALLEELDALAGGEGAPGRRAVVPVAAGRPQPLAAAYTAGCAEAARRCVAGGELAMEDLLGRLDEVRTVEAEDLAPDRPSPGGARPGARLFMNVNTPEDLREARRLAREQRRAAPGEA